MGRRACHIKGRACLLTCVILSVGACKSAGEGYWTKRMVAQAITNEQYPEDSRDCERIAAKYDTHRQADGGSPFYTRCMYARGYEWIVERPRSEPLTATARAKSDRIECQTGRMIVDSFGSQKCVPAGGKDRGPVLYSQKADAVEDDAPRSPNRDPGKGSPPTESHDDDWKRRDAECRRHVEESLSSPYGVYVQCMQEHRMKQNR